MTTNPMDTVFASLLAVQSKKELLASYQDLLTKAKAATTGLEKIEIIGAMSQVVSELKNRHYQADKISAMIKEINDLT